MKDVNRLWKLWKLIGKGVLNFFGSRFFDKRKDKLIFDDNNQKTQWEKDFKLLAPENWTNGQLKILMNFSKMWIPDQDLRVRIDIKARLCQTGTPKVRTALHFSKIRKESGRQRDNCQDFSENQDKNGTMTRHGQFVLVTSGHSCRRHWSWLKKWDKLWSA